MDIWVEIKRLNTTNELDAIGVQIINIAELKKASDILNQLTISKSSSISLS